ncbi:hypothetical protein BpHYR1_029127 [Brachionus plicatilis]|uniref:Uncharacterized protein n=1 Tax=Brachionus plicatilis TaxID=10195 RepID=A0A3M7R331_BRAPC|nr:hypothetical protein BpHYR1_029127 [Brachionus plicatilis]
MISLNFLKQTCTFLFLDSSSAVPFPTEIVEEEPKNKMQIYPKKFSEIYINKIKFSHFLGVLLTK